VTLFLILGTLMAGVAFILFAVAVSHPRMRAAENLQSIDAYGFSAVGKAEAANRPSAGALDRVAGMIGSRAAARWSTLGEEELRRLLISAGLYRTSPYKIIGYRIIAAAILPAMWLLTGIGGPLNLFATPLILILGWRIPMILLQRRSRARIDEIDRELPELIDLLVITVESGLGLSGSLQTAADRITGPLGDELRLMLQEQRMGLATTEALSNMAARCDAPAMRSFVRSLSQGETLGVSMGEIMRNIAGEMRKRRRASAEERAQKAPVKILIPLIFLIFPVMLIVILGPAVITLKHMFGGG
jgi:tight adherence protein C